jgi:hypothetical protein
LKKNSIKCLLLITFVLLNFLIPALSTTEKWIVEQFSSQSQKENWIDGWRERSFVGNTQYRIIEDQGNHVLHALADSAASGLYKKWKFNPEDWPVLTWRWKVAQIPDTGDERFKETDDYGARVYVVFPQFLFWKSRTISYIWARHLPKEASCPNPWMPKNEMMLAVESGNDSLGHWIQEKRNIYEDYKKLFGSDPPRVGAIAVLTDSDNTGGVAEAFYDDFILWQH